MCRVVLFAVCGVLYLLFSLEFALWERCVSSCLARCSRCGVRVCIAWCAFRVSVRCVGLGCCVCWDVYVQMDVVQAMVLWMFSSVIWHICDDGVLCVRLLCWECRFCLTQRCSCMIGSFGLSRTRSHL